MNKPIVPCVRVCVCVGVGGGGGGGGVVCVCVSVLLGYVHVIRGEANSSMTLGQEIPVKWSRSQSLDFILTHC